MNVVTTHRLQHENTTQECCNDESHASRESCVRNPIGTHVEDNQQKHRNVDFVYKIKYCSANNENQYKIIEFLFQQDVGTVAAQTVGLGDFHVCNT